jgi:hypothetical protein
LIRARQASRITLAGEVVDIGVVDGHGDRHECHGPAVYQLRHQYGTQWARKGLWITLRGAWAFRLDGSVVRGGAAVLVTRISSKLAKFFMITQGFRCYSTQNTG